MMRASQCADEYVLRSNLEIVSSLRRTRGATYMYEEESADTETWQSNTVADLLQEWAC